MHKEEAALVENKRCKLRLDMNIGRARISDVHALFGFKVGNEYEMMKENGEFGDVDEDKGGDNAKYDVGEAAISAREGGGNDLIQQLRQATEKRRQIAEQKRIANDEKRRQAALVEDKRRRLRLDMNTGRAKISDVLIHFGTKVGNEYEMMKENGEFDYVGRDNDILPQNCTRKDEHLREEHRRSCFKQSRREERSNSFDDERFKSYPRLGNSSRREHPNAIDYAKALSFMVHSDTMKAIGRGSFNFK